MKIDVIIPLYKPGRDTFELLDMLKKQSVPVNRIILMNTEKKYFEELVTGTDFWVRFAPQVEVYHLTRGEFDHGGTRRAGVSKSDADVFVMMTQDAVPADEGLIERLTGQLADQVAVSYARQLPRENSGVLERISREFNYPNESKVKGAADLEQMGIKTYFCSNVCAAYRRDVYDRLGGFVQRAIFNEDMIYAAEAVKAGYSIAYEAEACVIHAHDYTVGQQFHRNFDLGVSQAEHPEIFGEVPAESEGMRLVKRTVAELKRNRNGRLIPYFYIQCAGKYLGYQCGKHYRLFPRPIVRIMSSNKEYWKNEKKKG